jgi:protein phosphatase
MTMEPRMSQPLAAASHTDVGRERNENQDNLGACRTDDLAWWWVCDGMGGHLGGSTAARLAVETVEAHLTDPASAELAPRDRLRLAIEAANAVIHAESRSRRDLHNMGTTIVALGIDTVKGVALWAHVGDSRIYRLRGGTFRLLTRDHTMVQRLVDDGILTPEAAEKHPNSNVISRSLGGGDTVEVELCDEALALEPGDRFLLCSDGLHGMVTELDLARMIADLPPADVVPLLIDRANEAGGTDNITATVIQWGPDAPPADAHVVERPAPPPRAPRPPPWKDPLDEPPPPSTPTEPMQAVPAPAAPAQPAPPTARSTDPLDDPTLADDQALLGPLLAGLIAVAVLLYFFFTR